jgi:hypothetical protein
MTHDTTTQLNSHQKRRLIQAWRCRKNPTIMKTFNNQSGYRGHLSVIEYSESRWYEAPEMIFVVSNDEHVLDQLKKDAEKTIKSWVESQ